MNSPYMGNFRVSQCFSTAHTGLDLVGIDSKDIHATVSGVVVRAGWENALDHKQGFGLRVVIRKDNTNEYYFYGHMSEILVKQGDHVSITDIIGTEGSTGYSTGNHCHYEMRLDDSKAKAQDISKISGIPNQIGTYNDGYEPLSNLPITITIGNNTYLGTVKKK